MVEAFNVIKDNEVRNEFSEAFDKLDHIELIQLLSDLKYIPFKAFEDNFVDKTELANAIALFRLEYQNALALPEASSINEIRLASELIEFELPLANQLTRRELFILKEIVGLDSELLIHEVQLGECTLVSRVILYRYRVYDLHTKILPNQRITEDVIKKLNASAKDIGFTHGWLALGNLFANQEALSVFCLESAVLSKNIFGHCIFIELPSKEGKRLIRELGSSIKSRRRFARNIASQPARRIILDLSSNNIDDDIKENQVDTYISEMANKFMRRMLQIKLWTMGLYQEKLDHDFGPITTMALVEYVQTISDDEDELSRILFNLGNHQCAINIRYLITKHFIPVEQSAIHTDHTSVSQIFDFVLEDKSHVSSIRRNKRKQRKIKRESQKLKKTLEVDLRTESDTIIKGTQKKVRQYKARRGILKFFSKLFKFVKNIFNKILQLIKKLLNLIKKTIKIIYVEIKEAFQHFRDGLHFLFGNRVINPTTAITTDYDFDFDGITKIHTKPSAEALQMHSATIKRYASALYPTLNFVRIVITWGIRFAQGPIGWVKILVGIAKLFREMLSKKAKIQLA